LADTAGVAEGEFRWCEGEGTQMKFETKFVIVVDESLAIWQKLNVTAFLTSGIIAANDGIIGAEYKDGSGKGYLPLCIQPVLIMKSNRARLKTILQRANRRNIPASIYIEDMFSTGFALRSDQPELIINS
jgi:hypothetical protein